MGLFSQSSSSASTRAEDSRVVGSSGLTIGSRGIGAKGNLQEAQNITELGRGAKLGAGAQLALADTINSTNLSVAAGGLLDLSNKFSPEVSAAFQSLTKLSGDIASRANESVLTASQSAQQTVSEALARVQSPAATDIKDNLMKVLPYAALVIIAFFVFKGVKK